MSLAQRRAAIARATEVRQAKARLKRQIKARELSPSDALEHPAAPKLKAEEFLKAIPQVGPVKARKLLASIPVTGSRRILSLTERELDVLRELVA
jgi:hypothetical protein